MLLTVLLIFFGICVLIQSVYFIITLVRFSKYTFESQGFTPKVTVIVCAHNEDENLRELIPMLASQEYPSYEIMIVDDRSSDDTHEILIDASTRLRNLRYITVEHLPDHVNGKKYGLTLAIKASRHDRILLTDADCRPAGNFWIRDMMANTTDEVSFIIAYAGYRKEPGFLNRFIQFETLWTAMHYIGAAIGGNPYMATGRNLSYSKETFLKNKGFGQHANITGGDDDLFVNRHATGQNTRVVLTDEARTTSIPKHSWKAYYRQKLRHLSVGKYYRPATRFTLGMLTLSHIFGWVLLIVLLCFSQTRWWALGGYFIRTLCLFLALTKTNKTLKSSFTMGWALVFDFVFVIYYIIVGSTARYRKKIKWK